MSLSTLMPPPALPATSTSSTQDQQPTPANLPSPVIASPPPTAVVLPANVTADQIVQEIDPRDVIRIIEQFLKEAGLINSMKALQEESQVSLNTVESMDVFVSDITNGHWDAVLQSLASLKIPSTKLVDLYEQIVLELAEMREHEAARPILRQTQPMLFMRDTQPDRYVALERVVHMGSFDPTEVYGNIPKEKRRAAVARSLSAEVMMVAPSRLLALLGQSLKWQHLQGTIAPNAKFDLFRGVSQSKPPEAEMYPRQHERTIKLGQKTHAECVKFSPDGQYLVTGSVDGFIEVWDHSTGKLDTTLKYQADDEIMMHDTSVLCLGFSRDSEFLVSGSQDGIIKVWQLRSGKCIRKFEKAHEKGVTSVCFSKEGGAQQVLSASYDNTARIHGIKSGKLLKMFRGHTSFVNDAVFSHNSAWVITSSSDGTVKVWDAKTTDCLSTIKPAALKASSIAARESAVISVILSPSNPEQVLVCTRSNVAYLMSLKGQVIKTYTATTSSEAFRAIAVKTATATLAGDVKTLEHAVSSEKEHQEEIAHNLQSSLGEADFSCCAITTPKGDWVHCGAQDGMLYSFNSTTAKLEHVLRAHERGIIGMAVHPHFNLVATHCDDGVIKIWKS